MCLYFFVVKVNNGLKIVAIDAVTSVWYYKKQKRRKEDEKTGSNWANIVKIRENESKKVNATQ